MRMIRALKYGKHVVAGGRDQLSGVQTVMALGPGGIFIYLSAVCISASVRLLSQR